MANIDVHFISYAQCQPHRCLLVNLGAYNYTVLIADGEAVLSTPLRDL